MATKKVNLIISLKDNVSAGLGKIGGGLNKLKTGFGVMAKVAVASIGAISAAAAGLGVAIQKSFEFETAKVQLKPCLATWTPQKGASMSFVTSPHQHRFSFHSF